MNIFKNIEFVNPAMFWLLLLLPVAGLWYYFTRHKEQAQVKISTMKGFKTSDSWLGKLRPLLFVLRLLALTFIIVGLARPQVRDENTRAKTTNGIDIVLAIDVSASMLSKDLKPDRLEATKRVAANFIKARTTDRIGVVVYAGESYTKTPVTTDELISLRAINDIEYDNLLESGTAIGSGLGTAVNRLRESQAKSKVIILMTDGVNNTGFIDPKIASELAQENKIKVYTIGLGTNGQALTPVAINGDGSFRFGMAPVELDEQLMKKIAADTGGRYFRATNNKKLEAIYNEIDKLEKTEVEEFKFFNVDEKFRLFVLIALGLLSLEMLLRYTLFRTAA